ncbi:DUF2975 domain-containing protein [Staphylococcus pseudintermedius]|uniref:DUF2975 domain-containing protein n=2 Tax=Staphylococcus pseudintermedius TaxID=283734 RepID=UPI00203307AF|nr:DUF2975 domain-containing protein [Staphylococcus pseudintermedius]MDK3865291.1 DUF2975 domain-containing protein [Staphylococcus pseudintermedius]MDT0806355.1 DUF2975 domain-containing protein [Staphylococcus pseudintermedius]MDT0817067.1 DUF2975 domain-containing protein [Staphylococcus pseudintermedius]MDT0879431.1 DUF2975 domain-containing protein [Staphylococcus pseudintermedius]MDT0882725.1 DUF2975 domain-containing protein [Staphylococcus pseudintermedius]
MLSFLLLLSLTNAIKSLIDYNNLFDTSIFEADNAYKVYAMLFLLQLIFLCTIIILTIKLLGNIYGHFNYSEGNHTLIVVIAMLLFMYGVMPNFYHLLNAEVKYKEVLNSLDMGSLLIIVIGFVILALATIYEKSQKIKEENDLTI